MSGADDIGADGTGAGGEIPALLEAIFRTSQDAITVSKRGMHILCNDAYAALFARPLSEVGSGTPLIDLIAPSERGRIQDYIDRRVRGDAVPTTYVTRGLRPDGTEFDMEVRVGTYPWNGEIYKLVVLKDVTAQRQAEQALRDGAELYRAVFEINTAVKMMIDATDGSIVHANAQACEFYGYTAEELCALKIWDINVLPQGDLLERMAEVRQEKRARFVFQHRLKSGEIRDVEVHTGPLAYRGRSLLLSIVFDVTERRRLEEQLRQAQKLEALGRLAGGIAHDFNNLLTVMIGYADPIVEETDPASSTHRNAREFLLAARRAQELVAQLLAFGRRQVLQPRTLHVNDVVRSMTGLLEPLVGQRVRLELDLADDAGFVRADPSRIEQVVMNLVVNARDAMPEGGTITLGTRRADEETTPLVALVVSDTGRGMDGATRARIFEPFFTTKEKQRGTGLGLSTVYGIVSQSGGRIDVDSTPGRGSAFTVLLPRVDPETVVPAPVRTEDGARTRTVLVAEDEDDVRAFLVWRLTRAGYDVLAAVDGRHALALAAGRERVDLLVTDVGMPGMSGPALHDALCAARPGLPVVFVSGHVDDLAADVAARGTFLQKPFDGRTLLAAVEKTFQT